MYVIVSDLDCRPLAAISLRFYFGAGAWTALRDRAKIFPTIGTANRAIRDLQRKTAYKGAALRDNARVERLEGGAP